MITILDNADSRVIDKLYKDQKFPVQDITELPCLENDVFVLKSGSKSAMAIIRDGKLQLMLDKKITDDLKGQNLEQKVFLNYLYDPEVVAIICTGVAGSGKSLLSMGYAVDSIRSGEFQELVISRPPVAHSKKFAQGSLPGEISEKLKPWLAVFYDNISKVRQYLGIHRENKFAIREVSLEYIKGLTFDNSLIVLDEAEDLTVQELKAVLTRVGHNSKIIILGDIDQSTERGCAETLSKTSSAFRSKKLSVKEQRMVATVHLVDSLRSDFVNLVLKVL